MVHVRVCPSFARGRSPRDPIVLISEISFAISPPVAWLRPPVFLLPRQYPVAQSSTRFAASMTRMFYCASLGEKLWAVIELVRASLGK